MEITDCEKLGFSGMSLNVKERSLMEILMAKKRREEGLDEMLFWGKIYGSTADYLICFGVRKMFSGVPSKKFYFCNGETLQQLPELTKGMKEKVLAFGENGTFIGDPNAALDDEADEEDDNICRELHRLAYKVPEIDFDTIVVPQGAYLVGATHQVLKNKTFEGLDHSLASKLGSYYHFREPTKLGRKSILEKRGMVKSTQFLDPISEDTPSGVWSLQSSPDERTVSIRSLLWPGYFFFHRVNSNSYGGAYFGDGKKNAAILFMI